MTDAAIQKTYTLDEAARRLDLQVPTLIVYVKRGSVKGYRIGGELCFDEYELDCYESLHSRQNSQTPKQELKKRFEQRYGEGSFRKLIELLENPLLSYADIGHEFNASDATANYWCDAVHHRNRRNRLATYRRVSERRELFRRELFRGFYRHARQKFDAMNIEPVSRRNIRDHHFFKQIVRLSGKFVGLHRATRAPELDGRGGTKVYRLRHTRNNTDCLYYSLDPENFLFMRTEEVPRSTTYTDTDASPYYRFKNNFDSLN